MIARDPKTNRFVKKPVAPPAATGTADAPPSAADTHVKTGEQDRQPNPATPPAPSPKPASTAAPEKKWWEPIL